MFPVAVASTSRTRTYRITRTVLDPAKPAGLGYEHIATREATSAMAALDAFLAERGIREHFTPHGRKRMVGLGLPTITAELVR
jgi:hypothetical protein